MQLASLLAFAALAFTSVSAVAPNEPHPEHTMTSWKPTATVVETHTYTGTRVEHRWTNVPPYLYDTTFPITWTQTQTKTQYTPIITDVPVRRHARDFESS